MTQKSMLQKSQCFVYSTSKMVDEATDSAVMVAVFVLILILYVFGHIRNFNESMESSIQASRKEYDTATLVCILPVSIQSHNRNINNTLIHSL